MRTLGIDPGVHVSAWALRENDRTTRVGLLRGVFTGQGSFPDLLALPPLDLVVLERMRIYPFSPEDPNDLLDVQFAGAYLLGILSGISPVTFRIETPSAVEWKGQQPKRIHHGRLKVQCPEALDLIQVIGPVGLHHHVWDAVGLARWGEIDAT